MLSRCHPVDMRLAYERQGGILRRWRITNVSGYPLQGARRWGRSVNIVGDQHIGREEGIAKRCSPPIERVQLQRLERKAEDRAVKALRRNRNRTMLWYILPILVLVCGVAAGVFTTLEVKGDQRNAVIVICGTLTAALIAGSMAVISAVVTPAKIRTLEISLDYVERQLAELWGPLYGVVRWGQYHYNELLPRLGKESLTVRVGDDPDDTNVRLRRPDVSLDPFSLIQPHATGGGERWKLWAEFAGKQSFPRNDTIADMIAQKYALVGQDDMPDIQWFFEHEAEYRAKFMAVEEELSKRRRINASPELQHLYPEAFEYHIYHKLRFLRSLQNKYRLQIQGARKGEIETAARRAARYRARSMNPPAI